MVSLSPVCLSVCLNKACWAKSSMFYSLFSISLSGQSIPLRSLLRTNETFSEYLMNSLSVPNTTVTSLMRARVQLGQVRPPQRQRGKETLCVYCRLEEIQHLFMKNQPRGQTQKHKPLKLLNMFMRTLVLRTRYVSTWIITFQLWNQSIKSLTKMCF